MQEAIELQGDGGRREKLVYRAPKLARLGTIQAFVLGGSGPGTDMAVPEEDGSTS
ncbi:MAG: hypothetical protein JWN34_728 [Bryobacterales bacterium]|jgi:hypothetical protein|nr:hypothetical protein [Bryobacterales bacterium]